MEPSIKCYNWIASKEGWRNNTYQDSVGIWTIGLGVRNDGFKYGKSISNERVIELFLQHVKSNASDVIKKWKKYFGNIEPLQNELDCMIAMKYQGAITYPAAANAIEKAGNFKLGMLNYIEKGRIVPITRKNETLKIFKGDFSNVKSYSTWEFNHKLIFDKNFNPHYPISVNNDYAGSTDIKPVEQTPIVSGTSSNSSGNNDYAGSTESQQAQLDYSGLMYDENAVSKTSDISKTEANEKNTSPTTNDGKSVFCKSENTTDLNDVTAKQITNPNIIMENKA